MPTTLPEKPATETTAPPEGWTPVVGGNASTYGEPDRADLQWAGWQPNCPDCEPGATLSKVVVYAYPFNGGVGAFELRPMIDSACLHRERKGPLIDWGRDVAGDRVDSLRVDGVGVEPGRWWVDGSYMIPEPGAFIELVQDAQELRVLTLDGHDATFAVAGFLTTPVQANLDHYP